GWQAGAAEASGAFEVRHAGRAVGTLAWDLLGRHNQLNALAAIAAAGCLGVPAQDAIAALARFRGVRRRLERIGEAAGVTVYDDFAHHPSAIETTLAGLRARLGTARILAVLEPRSNTMKLGVWRETLAPSLAGADRVFCYGGGIGWDVAGALAPLGAKAVVLDELDALIEAIAREARA